MLHKTNISILVVTHNHASYIERLLNSLELFDYHNVYICDAASSDETVKILESSIFSKNTLFKNKLEGFSKNNNDLIRHFNLETSYYLLLNPDVYFDEDFMKILFDEIESDKTIGIITPLVKYPNGIIQTTWKRFPNFLQVILKRIGLRKTSVEKQQESGIIDWCLGACLLIRSSFVKEDHSLLDERYRLYCEDVDICFEAKVKDLKVIGCDKTQVYHHLKELSSKNIFSKYNWWNIISIMKFAAKWNFKFLLK